MNDQDLSVTAPWFFSGSVACVTIYSTNKDGIWEADFSEYMYVDEVEILPHNLNAKDAFAIEIDDPRL